MQHLTSRTAVGVRIKGRELLVRCVLLCAAHYVIYCYLTFSPTPIYSRHELPELSDKRGNLFCERADLTTPERERQTQTHVPAQRAAPFYPRS